MRKYEEEGNLEMIEQLKIHGTKESKKKGMLSISSISTIIFIKANK